MDSFPFRSSLWGMNAIFFASSAPPFPAMNLPLNLNFGIARHPLDPLASTPSPCPRTGSPEVTKSFTLAISSSDSRIPASQVEGVEKMGCSNEDVARGAGRSSSQFVVLWIYFLLTLCTSIPLNQLLQFITHAFHGLPHLFLTLSDCHHSGF